jgi:hypothetical protein
MPKKKRAASKKRASIPPSKPIERPHHHKPDTIIDTTPRIYIISSPEHNPKWEKLCRDKYSHISWARKETPKDIETIIVYAEENDEMNQVMPELITFIAIAKTQRIIYVGPDSILDDVSDQENIERAFTVDEAIHCAALPIKR